MRVVPREKLNSDNVAVYVIIAIHKRDPEVNGYWPVYRLPEFVVYSLRYDRKRGKLQNKVQSTPFQF